MVLDNKSKTSKIDKWRNSDFGTLSRLIGNRTARIKVLETEIKILEDILQKKMKEH